MTREEAIAILEVSKHMATSGRLYNQAIDMAIEALKGRPHGEWLWRTDIPIGDGRTSAGYVCSNCGKDYWHGNVLDVCPNCGARMTPYKGGDSE